MTDIQHFPIAKNQRTPAIKPEIAVNGQTIENNSVTSTNNFEMNTILWDSPQVQYPNCPKMTH